MSNLKVLSLFSGCGGMDLGFEGGFQVHSSSIFHDKKYFIDKNLNKYWVKLKKTGFQHVFANDIIPEAKIVWENYFQKKDIYQIESIIDLVKKAKDGKFLFPDADIITGGFPCQDFSLAGKRNGFNSKKSHLGKLTHNLEPSEENRGLLYMWMREVISLVKPKIFIAENVKGLVSLENSKEIIEKDFKSIGNNGYFVFVKILNAAHFGVPQNRERIIFIGVSKAHLKKEFLCEPESSEIFMKLYPKETHLISGKIGYVKSKSYLEDLLEPEYSQDLSHQSYSKASYYGKHCQGQTEINFNGLAPTIRAEHHGNIEFRRLAKENGGKIISEHYLSQRRLSVRECARLQTFPDDYQFVLPKNVSASMAYKLIGNAVPPLMAYHIAINLKEIWNDLFLSNDKKYKRSISEIGSWMELKNDSNFI